MSQAGFTEWVIHLPTTKRNRMENEIRRLTMQANDLMDNYPSEIYARIRKDVEGDNEKRNQALRLIVETFQKYPDALLPTPLLAAIIAAKEVL